MKFRRSSLYRFSPKTLTFVKIQWGRLKLLSSGALLCVILLGGIYGVNQYYGDFLGIAYLQQSTLAYENQVLRDQLQYLTKKIDDIQTVIAKLGDEGNEFRLLVNLPKIDKDVQKVAIGGVEERIDFTSSTEINDLLNQLRTMVGKAERELSLQQSSYDAVIKMYEQNKIKFAHLPAIKPAEGFYSPNSFGIRFHPILHIYRMHEGIDITNELGTPIYATAEGVVDFAGRQSGLGLTIEIDHGFSLKTVYGHLSKILVREGQTIKRGELIGAMGNTGLSSGPHLHYEVRINGVAQNPIDYFFNDIHPTALAQQ